MTDLETRLRELDLAEPPLGFDPDDLADRAAKQTRLRVAVVGGTLAAGAVVAAVAVFGSGASPVPAPPAAKPGPPPAAEQARIRQALTDAVTRLKPGLRSLSVGTSSADAVGPGRFSATATFVDAAGWPGSFQVTLRDVRASDDVVPLARVCPKPGEADELRCDKIPQPGGAVLVVYESGYASGGDLEHPQFTKLRGINGTLYRPDGSTVTIFDADDGVPGVTDSVQLTQEQLTKVITDPAFTLR